MATRKTIVEATSKIIGQKEVDHLSRGPLDLTRRIDELEAEVSALKMKLEMLDNRPSKWYNKFMNDCGSLINNTIRNIQIQQYTINIQRKYIWIQV